MKFILGQKKFMTQIFKENGTVIPVTAVAVEQNVITQVRTVEKDGYAAVQVGSGRPAKNLKKPQQGHLKELVQTKELREFRMDPEHMDASDKYARGVTFGAEIFRAGDKVQVTGRSKGQGFQGVVKRHNFAGAPASHGTKDQLRMPGSIGATGPAHVFKGRRMPGRMGDEQVTVTGLSVAKVDLEKNLLYITGAIPGSINGLVVISGGGTFKPGNVPGSNAADEVATEEEAATPEDQPKEQAEEQTENEKEEKPSEEKGDDSSDDNTDDSTEEEAKEKVETPKDNAQESPEASDDQPEEKPEEKADEKPEEKPEEKEEEDSEKK